MAKIKVAVKKNQIVVKSKLDKRESINGVEFKVFQTKLIRGLMRPSVEGDRVITYTAPAGITLAKYLKSGITRNDFFLVLAQTIEMIKKVERNHFDINNIVLDFKCIFINVMTKEVSFIYQPILNSQNSVDLLNFIYSIANTAKFDWQDEATVVPRFVNFINSMHFFSTLAIEEYILKEYPQVYKQIQRTKDGHSQILNGKKWEVDSGNIQYTGPQGEEDTALLVEEEQTALLEDEEQTTLLIEDDCDATTLLEPVVIKKPYLIRVNTQERADINKEVFKIGKDSKTADFHITGNSAVSRQHADIIVRDECYFIKDNNSTNKTYVNDVLAPAGEEVEIHDGDKIVLANEPFEFHVDEE